MTPEQIVEHVNTLIEHSPRVRMIWEAWEESRQQATASESADADCNLAMRAVLWKTSKERFGEWFLKAVGEPQKPHALSSAKLSPREEQVAELLALGHKCREIAEKLGVSTQTIDTHRAHILKKLGLRNVVELARRTMAAE